MRTNPCRREHRTQGGAAALNKQVRCRAAEAAQFVCFKTGCTALAGLQPAGMTEFFFLSFFSFFAVVVVVLFFETGSLYVALAVLGLSM